MSQTLSAYHKKTPAQKAHKLESNYRNRMARADKLRNLAPLPPIEDPERKEACRYDLKLFLETYCPEAFPLEFGEMHLRFIGQAQEIILNGGQRITAQPRGSGKSTILIRAVIWALIYGHHRFLILIAATAKDAEDLLKAIKTQLTYNKLLIADFNSAYCISCLENEPLKAKGQRIGEESTAIVWRANQLSLPRIDGEDGSEAEVRVAGITGAIRGASKTLSDGSVIRPSLALVDDFQDKKSASSPATCQSRIETINNDIIGLAGPGETISALISATIIAPNDAADQLLDPDNHIEWLGERIQMLTSEPLHKEYWDEYYSTYKIEAVLRPENKKDIDWECTKYYLANKDKMQEGAAVSWPARYQKEFVDAIENAMFLKYSKPEYFAAECQNEPIQNANIVELPKVQDFIKKQGPEGRKVIPPYATKLVGHIDVQANSLWFAILAVDDAYTGQVIDYGAWPPQKSRQASKASLGVDFDQYYPGLSVQAQTHQALTDLYSYLSGGYMTAAGKPSTRTLDRIMVDDNYNVTKSQVQGFASRHGNVCTGYGKYNKTPEDSTKWLRKRKGYKCGTLWLQELETNRIGVDANYWKRFVHERIAAPIGDPGSLTLYKDEERNHITFAQMVLESESPIKTNNYGYETIEYKEPPGAINEYFDNLYNAYAMASVEGAAMPGEEIAAKKVKPRPKIKDFASKWANKTSQKPNHRYR